MFLDLEAEKIVDRFDRVGIGRVDFDLSAEFGAFGRVRNLPLKTLHGLHPGRVGGMDEHRNGKVAVAEHAGNRAQMIANCFLAGGIRGIVGVDFNGAAVSQEMKMMAGHLVTEAHALVASVIHGVVMGRRRGVFRLGLG